MAFTLRKSVAALAAGGLSLLAASSASAGFVGFVVVANNVTSGGVNLVRYEVFARFNGANDTLLNVFDLDLVSTACGDAWGGYWHKDNSDDNGGTLSQSFGTWAPQQTGSATLNRPVDSFVLIGGNPVTSNTTSADPSWSSGGSGSHAGGSSSWTRADLVNNGDLGWFNSNPPNLQGRVNVAPNTTTDVKVGQFVLRGGLPERTFSLTVGYNTGVPGALYATGTFVIGASVPADCNGNNTADACEIVANPSLDCDGNGLIDSCELASGSAPDCDGDGRIDACSILAGGVADANANGIPDMCEAGAGSVVTDWPSAGGGNGHAYQIVVVPGGVDWLAAYEAAAGRGGHLVTLGSSGEDAFVRALIAANPESRHYAAAPWMGLYQNTAVPGFTEPNGGWTWVTGEPLAYTGWLSTEPNNFNCGGQIENYASYYYSGADLGWNDQQFSGSCVTPAPRQRVSSYVIEWDADCNGNGTVDIIDIGGGSAADCNQNGVPDSCDIAAGRTTDCNGNGTPDSCDIAAGNAVDANGNSVPDSCEAAGNIAQWTSADGGNGHWYEIVSQGSALTWTAAKAAAEAKGGHLFTANSGAENAFMFAKVGSKPSAWRNYYLDIQVGPWIGAERISQTIGSAAFRWVTNESFTGFAWFPGNPGLPPTSEEKVQLLSRGPKAPTWSDAVDSVNSGVVSYVIEYDADCNGDGIVDIGQILSGQFSDADGNGVPDCCSSQIGCDGEYDVPSEFPSVQAAINAAPATGGALIVVAPGIYTAPFDLNGKDVVVRGAGSLLTVFDGSALTNRSFVRLNGEPGTACIEDVGFVNCQSGSPFNPPTQTFKVGGAIFGFESAACIRRCRFQNCRSTFGGAVYMRLCDLAIEDCVFTGNTALTDAGALFISRCLGFVADSQFTGNICGGTGSGGGSAIRATAGRLAGDTTTIVGCTFTGNTANVSGAALEWFPAEGDLVGNLRIEDCVVTDNTTGGTALTEAAGLRNFGAATTLTLADSVFCDNTPRNVSGGFLAEGVVEICDCAADLAIDGVVNGADLSLLLGSWGPAAPGTPADINRDGFVNGADLTIVLGNWGVCAP